MINKKTAIHILPSRENDKEKYLILFLDEKANANLKKGNVFDENQVIGFCPENLNGKTITNIIIEMVNGIPNTVRIVEDCKDIENPNKKSQGVK